MTVNIGTIELSKYNGPFSHVVIPPDVNIIKENAFLECESIRTLDISSNVGEIRGYAFARCKNLESVTMTNLIMRIEEHAFEGCEALKQIQVVDMSQQYAPKVQRKIHRNFYKALQSIRAESAEAYAKQYNVPAKSSFLDLPFSRQIKKETEDHVSRLTEGYEGAPITKSLYDLLRNEEKKSDRLLTHIELFRDSIAVTGVKAGNSTHREYEYKDFNIGIRSLPDANHILACATVLVRLLGDDYCVAPVTNKESVVIRPSIS